MQSGFRHEDVDLPESELSTRPTKKKETELPNFDLSTRPTKKKEAGREGDRPTKKKEVKLPHSESSTPPTKKEDRELPPFDPEADLPVETSSPATKKEEEPGNTSHRYSKPYNNDSLRIAVGEWCNNQTKAEQK